VGERKRAASLVPCPSAWESATRTFGELLIDSEEDRTLRAVFVGMLR
jgi:hypothetical protein